ncbi:MAG: ATPase, T2SS/T4P/T4SS family, partial [Candidatus Wallbacteria bacterium]|nr:ATPase, T2SS/T4P/T4SS family [Candidatus Wallbacteria bacterium]
MNRKLIADLLTRLGEKIASGLPLPDAIAQLEKDPFFSEIGAMIHRIHEGVKSGTPLSNCLAKAGFGYSVISAVSRAENQGDLDKRMPGIVALVGAEGELMVEAEAKKNENEAKIVERDNSGFEGKARDQLNDMIESGIEMNASDLHIIPTLGDAQVRFRIKGMLKDGGKVRRDALPALTAAVKTMCRMDVEERMMPQDGRFLIRVRGRECDIRVSIMPSVSGEKLTMRFLQPDKMVIGLDRVMAPEAVIALRKAMEIQNGLILVT